VRPCPQCGSAESAKQGRCPNCGALIDAAAVARRERISERLDHHFGDPLGWFEVVPVLLVAGLIVAGVIPAWTILFALVLAARPLWRLAVRIFAAWAEGP